MINCATSDIPGYAAINLLTESAKLEHTKYTIVFHSYQNWGQSTEEKEMKKEMMTRSTVKLELFCINCIQIVNKKIKIINCKKGTGWENKN